MRPVFGIGRLLICMTLISDYSSSVLIHDDNLIHSEFCKEYQNLDPETILRQILLEIDDTDFGKRLCPVIGKELYGDDAECEYFMHNRMTVVASLSPEPFRTYGQVCECKNGDGIQLAEFGIKRTSEESVNDAYVLRPRGQPTDVEIHPDTVLYAVALHFPENQMQRKN